MRLFRTISLNEFSKVMFGEAILPKVQNSPNCYYTNENGQVVSASTGKPEFICCFEENIFWYCNDDRVVMLELDVPDDRVFSRGYGNYYTMMWNPFVSDTDGGFYVSGEFGLKRAFRDGVEMSLKETYLTSYSREDVVSVYFLDNVKLPNMGVDYDEDYVQFQACDIYNIVISNLSRLTSQKHLGLYKNNPIWYRQYTPSLNFLKKLLIKEVEQFSFADKQEVISFISKWKFYNDIKVLQRGLLNNNLSTAFNRTLSMWNIAYTLNQYFTTRFIILENMYDVPKEKPAKLIEFVQKFQKKYTSGSLYNTTRWDWNICEQFIYSMMKKANII